MRVRRAGVDDLQGIMSLEEDAFGPKRFSEEFALKLMTDPNVVTLVAEEDRMVAYAMVNIIQAYETGEVLSLAVAPGRRRHGIGRRMMEEVENVASDGGAVTMMLYVRPDNAAAVSLYISLGYKVLARCRGYYADGSDADMMVKHMED